jgi:hypothetical protein
LKTPCFRSSASLSRVTRCDQRFGDVFGAADFVRDELAFRAIVFPVFLRAVLRVATLGARAVFRRSAIFDSYRFSRKTVTDPIGSFAAMREPARPKSVS